MKHMEFYPVRPGSHGGFGGLHRHFRGFSRQTQNDVGHHIQPCRLQPPDSIEIHLVFIAPAERADGIRMDGLQPQLHADGLFRI